MKNIKKILALTLCSSAMLVGCNKRQKITLEVANDFCLKNYKAITKECSQVSADYNLHFNFTDEDTAKDYAKLIVCRYSLYDRSTNIPDGLITINGNNLTIKGNNVHVNDQGTGAEGNEEFLIKSLGVRKKTNDKIESYLFEYISSYFSECDIYVANNNNIVINGTAMIGNSENTALQPIYISVGEDSFDNDGCFEKSILKISKGTEIKDTANNVIFTVSDNSSVTAKYSYF